MKYRDTKTGRFVSAATWKRSRAHGGRRYRRIAGSRQKRMGTVRLAALPSNIVSSTELAVPGSTGKIRVKLDQKIPREFLEIDLEDYFEAGYEADEEDEY